MLASRDADTFRVGLEFSFIVLSLDYGVLTGSAEILGKFFAGDLESLPLMLSLEFEVLILKI